jgi:hypothetical protein
MTKAWWKSKTLWFNFIVAALILAEINLHYLEGHLPPWLFAWLAFSLPLINMGLRFVSTHGLSFRPAMPMSEEDAK